MASSATSTTMLCMPSTESTSIRRMKAGDRTRSFRTGDMVFDRDSRGTTVDMAWFDQRRRDHHVVFVMFAENMEILGVICVRDETRRVLYLRRRGVAERMQNQGIGTRLFRHIVEFALAGGYAIISAHIRKDNLSACTRVTQRLGQHPPLVVDEYEDEHWGPALKLLVMLRAS